MTNTTRKNPRELLDEVLSEGYVIINTIHQYELFREYLQESLDMDFVVMAVLQDNTYVATTLNLPQSIITKHLETKRAFINFFEVCRREEYYESIHSW